METKNDDPMNAARMRLILDQERTWWGILGLRLKVEPKDTIPTAETDGTTLWYNAGWFGELSKAEQDAVCAHEIEHCALGHPFRMGSRDRDLANVAMDHVINLDLAQAGFRLPQPCYQDSRF